MKAIVYKKYAPADVLHLQEVGKPTPKDNEVLIKVHATSLNAGDCNTRGFVFVPPGFGFVARLMFGLRKPRQPILRIIRFDFWQRGPIPEKRPKRPAPKAQYPG